MKITKEHLEEAFKRGMSFDFRPTFFMCFNRWYNEKFVDAKKCLSCTHSAPASKVNYKTCNKCIDCNFFQAN